MNKNEMELYIISELFQDEREIIGVFTSIKDFLEKIPVDNRKRFIEKGGRNFFCHKCELSEVIEDYGEREGSYIELYDDFKEFKKEVDSYHQCACCHSLFSELNFLYDKKPICSEECISQMNRPYTLLMEKENDPFAM